MKLKWDPTLNTVIIEFHDNTFAECPGGAWSRVSAIMVNDIFATINKYWSTLPMNKVLDFENIYKQIMECFNDRTDAHVLNPKLKPLCEQLLRLFDWNYFKLWCVNHGGLRMDNGIKESLDDKDKEGLTYYTEDYKDLLVLSVMLKSILPVWGAYHDELTDSIGKYHIHIAALDLIRSEYFNNLPPLVKLESYIEAFTEIKITKAGYSLLSGIGGEEVPSFLLALALIKKVVIFNVQDGSASIVKNVYHLLTERCKEITRFKPNEKKDIDSEGGDLSIADRYKIVQRIPPAVSEMLSFYGSDFRRVARDIDPTIPDVLIEKYAGVKPDLDIKEFHLPILSFVCVRVMKGRSLRIIPYGVFLNMIKASAAALDHWGFLEIAELITSTPSPKDIYQVSSSLTGNRSFKLLDIGKLNDLNLIYRYTTNNKNPGITVIDNILTEVIKYDWRVKSENFNDLRNSIATLIVKQLGGVPICTTTAAP